MGGPGRSCGWAESFFVHLLPEVPPTPEGWIADERLMQRLRVHHKSVVAPDLRLQMRSASFKNGADLEVFDLAIFSGGPWAMI